MLELIYSQQSVYKADADPYKMEVKIKFLPFLENGQTEVICKVFEFIGFESEENVFM